MSQRIKIRSHKELPQIIHENTHRDMRQKTQTGRPQTGRSKSQQT